MVESRSKMSGGVLTHVSEYLLNLEQHLLAITYMLIGASAGLLTGSVSATKKLKNNFTSTDGLRDLIYGSEHRDEKDRRSVSDLLKSWVPGFQMSSAPVKQSKSLLSTTNYAISAWCVVLSGTSVESLFPSFCILCRACTNPQHRRRADTVS